MRAVHPAVAVIKSEFEKHVDRGVAEAFSPSFQATSEFGKFVKSLERKKQTGALTEVEEDMLKSTDELRENIARYNKLPKATQKSMPGEEKIYNPLSSAFVTEEDRAESLSIPRISAEEADEIIAHLNSQFEGSGKNAGKPSDDHPPGRNLDEYLKTVK